MKIQVWLKMDKQRRHFLMEIYVHLQQYIEKNVLE